MNNNTYFLESDLIYLREVRVSDVNEQYYNFVEVHPKIVSVLYAADRWESSAQIIKWLEDDWYEYKI